MAKPGQLPVHQLAGLRHRARQRSAGRGRSGAGENLCCQLRPGRSCSRPKSMCGRGGFQNAGPERFRHRPSTTKPGEQVTYAYNYINNSGVYAIGSYVRLAAPITEDNKHLAFVPGSYPPSCTGIHAGTAPRADYIDCPIGDLVDGAGAVQRHLHGAGRCRHHQPQQRHQQRRLRHPGKHGQSVHRPSGQDTIMSAATTLVDLAITVSNGGVSSYAVGGR